MTALILQARLDSGRLSEKSLLPLGGRPLVLRVMEAFSFFPCTQKILACPDDCEAQFAPLAEEAGFRLVLGPKDDVLERYCIAARASGAQRIIRSTGDNPFVFSDAAWALENEAQALCADYSGYSGLPYGAGVECVSCEALFRAEREAKKQMEREHVCPFLYGHPELFSIHRPLAPLKWQGPDFRITVDTQEDYDRAGAIYERLLSLAPEDRSKGVNIISAYKELYERE